MSSVECTPRATLFKHAQRLIFPAALIVGFTTLSAADVQTAADLRAGFARADITPDPRMLNWTLTPPRPYGEVHDPLFVRALVLSDSRTKVVFLGWDLLDAREYAVARMRTAISQATGIPAAHIMIQATHNHSGPKSEMGKEPGLKREMKASRPTQDGPAYREWADRLVTTCVDIVRKADAALQPANLTLGRAYVGEWLFNRRPVRSDGTVLTMMLPKDPYVLGNGLRFGAVDPTMNVLSLRDQAGKNICTLFHVPMHAVAVYSAYKGISADWPGRVTDMLREKLGGDAFFLQGCAGDIVPARRGFEAVEAMSELISARAAAADKAAAKIKTGPIRVSHAVLGLPATATAAEDLGREAIDAEVSVVTMGPLAFVTLPGEPLQELATAIQKHSPYEHTLVLGYANGRGVGYVGLPGGKVKGGYEMSEVGAGADEAGGFLVETAVRLLRNPITAPDKRGTK
ncbi:MAG: neutral/alkaline non-lysosomal ceramidase N-terminal domain-containing protein [Opitutaceae bacterium]|nr:neutral/alkaline non-lysosomal ceramidase N-terminal domain-containing protein [Opitutaceae bacterium]